MVRSKECELYQVAIEAIIDAYGIRFANKNTHRDARDLAIKKIVLVLEEYKVLSDLADGK